MIAFCLTQLEVHPEIVLASRIVRISISHVLTSAEIAYFFETPRHTSLWSHRNDWAKHFIQQMLLALEHFFSDFACRGRFERAVVVLVLDDDVLARGHEDDCWSDVMHS